MKIQFLFYSFILLLSLQGIVHAEKPLYTYTGQIERQHLGRDVGLAGDINNDGYDDFIISEFFPASGCMSSIYSGLDGTLLPDFNCEFSVRYGGDLNGDDTVDFILSTYEFLGRTFLFVSGADNSVLYSFQNPEVYTEESISDPEIIGDVNNDNKDDFIVKTHIEDENYDLSVGFKVFSGVDGELLYTYQDPQPENDSFFSGKGIGAGDVNNDGASDFLISAPGYDTDYWMSGGAVFVYSGSDGSLLHVLYGEGSQFGWDASKAGDVNKDGFDDFMVGSLVTSENGQFYNGGVKVFSGQDASVLYTFLSQEYGFGRAVSGGYDYNCDSYPDFLMGGSYGEGEAVFVFSGRNGSLLNQIPTPHPSIDFGFYLSFIGDVNHDGAADILVGAPQDSRIEYLAGSAYLYGGECPPDPLKQSEISFEQYFLQDSDPLKQSEISFEQYFLQDAL